MSISRSVQTLNALQKHRGRASGSLDGGSRSTMDRMMSTPLANRDTGRITHRISKTRDDFWKAQKEAFDKKEQAEGKDKGRAAIFVIYCCS